MNIELGFYREKFEFKERLSHSMCKLICAADERHLKMFFRHLFSKKMIDNFNMFGTSTKNGIS